MVCQIETFPGIDDERYLLLAANSNADALRGIGAADALRAQPVRLQHGATVTEGVARGIDREGALLFEAGGRLERVVSGEVSVRPAA